MQSVDIFAIEVSIALMHRVVSAEMNVGSLNLLAG